MRHRCLQRRRPRHGHATHGPQLDEVAYINVIHACAEESDAQRAELWFSQIRRALFALLSGHGSAAERGPRARQGGWGPQRKPRRLLVGSVGDAAGEVELLKGEVSRLRAEQQWLAISRIPRMPAAEGFSWLDGQNGQVSDRQRRGEAPQYPRLLHPVACAAPRAWTCGSRTCSSCSLTAILSLLPSLIFAVLTARTSLAGRQPFGTPRQRAASAGVT